MEVYFLHFYPKLWKIEILSRKNFQISEKGKKRGGGVSKFYNFEKKTQKKTGVKFYSRWKSVCVCVGGGDGGGGGSIPRSLPTNLTHIGENLAVLQISLREMQP